MISTRKREKRRASFARKKRDKEDIFIRKMYFRDPIRGGKLPSDFQLNDIDFRGLDSFFQNELKYVLMNYGEIFLDNGVASIFQFELPERRVGIGNLYCELIRYAEQNTYRQNIQNLIDLIENGNKFFIDAINQSKVIIIKEVLDEFRRYLRTIMNCSRESIVSKQLRGKIVNLPKILYEALERNYERHRFREANPLIERISGSLPSITSFGKKISDTDKKLVSMAIAFSIIDGESRSILTTDSDINYLMYSLEEMVNSQSGLQIPRLKPVNLVVNSILSPSHINSDGYTIKTRAFYDLLNPKK